MARSSLYQADPPSSPKRDESWVSEDELVTKIPAVSEDGNTTLPGYGRPINFMLKDSELGWESGKAGTIHNRCPNALQSWAPEPITVREKNMLSVINNITDKSDWRTKVFDETIVAKWRAEAVTEEGQGFTDKMFDYCMAELRDKAAQHKESGIVAVLDSEWAVVKSDDIVSTALKEELKTAVLPLENVPESEKDWHPGSNEQVLDLIHPSLFPLVYGRSRIIPNGTIALDDCIQNCGRGEVVPVPGEEDCKFGAERHWRDHYGQDDVDYWSSKFQWLPSNVAFTDDQDVKITSYINNLHPVHHKSIYPVIEKLIAKSVPAWDLVLSSFTQGLPVDGLRVPMTGTEYEFPLGEEAPEDVGRDLQETDEDEYYEVREQWVRDNRVLIRPDARNYDTSFLDKHQGPMLNLREHFSKSGIQVIVKLANIHLTPKTPEYSGGTWHIEGKLNEHICATSLYYYDNENITDSHLAFRHKVSTDDIISRDYGQDDNDGVCYLFDIERGGPGVQTIGQVTTNEGRLLAFPNVLQHQVQPFKLVDPTKPGHRKILALFLIDPFQRVISTANVPPQQREWWAEAVNGLASKLDLLPPEIRQEVMKEVDDFPISLDDAKKLRVELMEERKAFVRNVNDMYEADEFSFCEH